MLKDKTILILSPQSWGKMFVSKHHYALELAKRGNLVFFLNPPDVEMHINGEIRIVDSPYSSNLKIIHHSLGFPYKLKFHLPFLFHFLMRGHVRRLTAMINKHIDIVWSFDLGNIYPLRYFKTSIRIFHPVDEPRNRDAANAGEHADIIFSVTKEILDKYSYLQVPRILVNHGVNEIFFQNESRFSGNKTLHIGLSGNLIRGDIDRETLIRIIRENLNCIFEFWGSYKITDANIGGGDDEATRLFINGLSKLPNVILHGAVNSEELVKGFSGVDAFLICYDVLKDQSKGTNYHKVMEYLATGKPIVSNNISSYQGTTNLVYMVESRTTNAELPDLFRTVISDISRYSTLEMSQCRIEFAKENTYSKKVEEIEGHLKNFVFNV